MSESERSPGGDAQDLHGNQAIQSQMVVEEHSDNGLLCEANGGTLARQDTGSDEGYSDVSEKDGWLHDTVEEASERGLVTGYEDGSFKPGNLVTQQEFFTLIYRSLRIDVAWENVMEAASSIGALVSDDPSHEVTRGEAAFIICTLSLQPVEHDGFAFLDTEGHQYGVYLETLRKIGIFHGDDAAIPRRTTVRPDGTLSRAEAAAISLRTNDKAIEREESGALLPIELEFARLVSGGDSAAEALVAAARAHPDEFLRIIGEEWITMRGDWRLYVKTVKRTLDLTQIRALEVFGKALSLSLQVEDFLWEVSNGDAEGAMWSLIDSALSQGIGLLPFFKSTGGNQILFDSHGGVSDVGVQLFWEKTKKDFAKEVANEVKSWAVDVVSAGE